MKLSSVVLSSRIWLRVSHIFADDIDIAPRAFVPKSRKVQAVYRFPIPRFVLHRQCPHVALPFPSFHTKEQVYRSLRRTYGSSLAAMP